MLKWYEKYERGNWIYKAKWFFCELKCWMGKKLFIEKERTGDKFYKIKCCMGACSVNANRSLHADFKYDNFLKIGWE